jgi:hypothetical protein
MPPPAFALPEQITPICRIHPAAAAFSTLSKPFRARREALRDRRILHHTRFTGQLPPRSPG